jgi:hypothetical protein
MNKGEKMQNSKRCYFYFLGPLYNGLATTRNWNFLVLQKTVKEIEKIHMEIISDGQPTSKYHKG